MNALKNDSLTILIYGENRYTCLALMDFVFNKPDKIINGVNSIEYLYDNGDKVIWSTLKPNTRGIKYDYILCANTVDEYVKDSLSGSISSRNTIFHYLMRDAYCFNEYSETRFIVI